MTFLLVSIAVLLAIGIGGGYLPTRIPLTSKGQRLLTIGNAFAGGVFLGGGLMHLIPDSQEFFSEFTPHAEYPSSFLLAASGFIFVLFLEKVLLGSDDVGTLSEGEKSYYPYVLTFVLSIHSLIAGISLGIESTTAAVFALFIAILVHKGFAAFALSTSLRDANFPPGKLMGVIAFFSCMTPLGIVLGYGFSRLLLDDKIQLAEGIFDALAGGTFLYVAVLDIIDVSFQSMGDRWFKFIALLMGFAIMSLLAIWA